MSNKFAAFAIAASLVPMFCVPHIAAHAQTVQSVESGTIRTIRVDGNQRIEDRTILSYLLIEPGDAFDATRIDLSLKALFATGLFADARFEREGNDLIITLVENPIINRVILEGNRALDDDKIREEIQLAPRGIFTAARTQADVQRILELYRQSGRFAVKVEPEYKPLEQNRVDVIFSITEGPVSGVRSINFIGNEAYSDSRLRGEIVTRQSRWWQFFSSNDNYDPGRLEYDRDLLRQFYQNRGYYDFRVSSAVAELTPDQKDFYITYTVDEGDVYEFGEVKVESALDRLNVGALQNALTARSGEVFRGDTIEDSIDALTYIAGVAGYAFVDITPQIDADPETNIVDVTFQLDEGPRVYIERINIVGNTQTLDRVVRRELRIAEGDAFNRVLLDRSRNRVRSLGFFKEVEIEERPGERPDGVIVDLSVEEQPTGELGFAAGFSSTESFLIDLNVAQRNVLGRGQSASARLSTSSLQQILDLRYNEPRLFDRNLAGGVNAFISRLDYSDTRLGGYTVETYGAGAQLGFPLSERLQLGLRYTLQHDSVNVNDATIVIDETGNRATREVILDDGGTPGDPSDDLVEQVFVEPDDILPEGALVVDNCDIRYIFRQRLCASERAEVSSTLGYSLRLNMANDPIRPTGGFDVSLSQDFAGIGGDVNYIRSVAAASFYRGITRDIVASLRLQGGYIEPFGTTSTASDTGQVTPQGVRINNRFFRGGNSFRGFDVAGLGPRIVIEQIDELGERTIQRRNALGGNAFYQGTLELSVPNYLPEEYGIRTSLFLEAGSVGLLSDVDTDDSVESISDTGAITRTFIEDELTLRASTGLSVSWNSPFGPIRFDFSQILRSEEYDRTETFRFSTSTRF